MSSIITFDVPGRHRELKQILFAQGYQDQVPGIQNCKIIYLPNTTLFHTMKTAEQAREDVRSTCTQLGIQLERCIATQWGPDWAAICGMPFS